MTTITARTKSLCEHDIPFECCNCPFSSVEGLAGKHYHCALIGESSSTDAPVCQGKRVTVGGSDGQVEVVRVEEGSVHFKVLMDDGSLQTIRCDECEIAE